MMYKIIGKLGSPGWQRADGKELEFWRSCGGCGWRFGRLFLVVCQVRPRVQAGLEAVQLVVDIAAGRRAGRGAAGGRRHADRHQRLLL